MGAGLVGLFIKGLLEGKSFTVFRNWLTLGGAIPPQSAKPQDVKESIIETRKCGCYSIASFSLEIFV